MRSRQVDPFSFYSEPRDGESAYGHITRLIGEEFHRNTRVYLDRIMEDHRGTYAERCTRLVRHMAMPEVAREQILKSTPITKKGSLFIGSQRFQEMQVSFKYRRFCPGCIDESPHHRVWWDVVAFRTCPLHRMALLDRNTLGRRFGWTWPHFSVDRFGFECGHPAKRDTNHDAFEYYLLQRLGHAEAIIERPILDIMPLARVIDMTSFVGRLLSNPHSTRTPKASEKDWQSGYDALKGSPARFERVLEEWLVKETDQNIRNAGVERAFGWARLGTRVKMLGSMRPLDKAMKLVLARNGRLGRRGVADLDEVVHREITLTELSERYQLHKKGMRRVLESIGVAVSQKGRISHFDKDKVGIVDKFVADLISEKEAATMLGCPRSVVWGLIRHARMRGYSRIARRNAVRLLVPRTDVAALLVKLDSLTTSGETHSIYNLTTFSRRSKLAPQEVVEQVLSGHVRLATIDRGRRGIAGWRFHIAALARPQRRRPRWRKPAADSMTRTEASVLTSFHPRTIRFLVRQGAIREARADPMWLDRKSVEDFHATYVKASLHYRELGERSPLKVVRGIERMGIPIRFKSGAEYYDTIVARGDLEKLTGTSSQIVASSQAQRIWGNFRAFYEEGYCAFHMPPEIGVKPQKLYLASRRCYFEVSAEEDAVLVVKTFSPKKVREWEAFAANRELFVESLKGFDWVEAGDLHAAHVRMRNVDDIKTVRAALDAVHWHIRTLIPRTTAAR